MTPVLERRVSGKASLGSLVLAILVALADLAAGLWMRSVGYSFWWLTLLIAPLPFLVYGLSLWLARSTAYRLFEDRLEIEGGLFSRSIENVDLFRVRDVGLRQGFLGRMLDFGDVYIHSTDSSTPDIHVKSVEDPRYVYEEVRRCVAASRAQHRTMIVEDSQPMPEA